MIWRNNTYNFVNNIILKYNNIKIIYRVKIVILNNLNNI